MPIKTPPLNHKTTYDEQIHGVFGNFGAGMGIRVCFLQAAVDAEELKKIHLVNEIPGSDRWPVRDLFQRDVDTRRVEKGILPWLQDEEKVKFFAPLALTLIPVEEKTNQILSEVPKLCQNKLDEDGANWRVLEREGLYRFRFIENDGVPHREYGMVEWNSRNVRLVAIDGQHRLSALKRYLSDQDGPGFDQFRKWNVPVIISGLDCERPVQASILDVVRNMFVYINTQAVTPSPSRQILLNDENIYHLCVQELLQYSHENDTVEIESHRDQDRVPLLFYDWRGNTENGREIPTPASLKSVVELAEWLRFYVLGDKGEEGLIASFNIDSDHPLHEGLLNGELRSAYTETARQRFREWILPGITYLLENFEPYQQYINSVRNAELEWIQESDVYRHAIAQLRFGSHRGGASVERDVTHAYDEVVQDLIDMKDDIPLLLRLDIGMRGVMYAYGFLKSWHENWNDSDKAVSWQEYSEWFTRNLNRMYRQKWFIEKGNALRLHVTRNAADNFVNYRIGDAQKALGPFVVTVVCRNAFVHGEVISDEEQWDEVWAEFAEGPLFATLRSGYQKQEQAELKSRYSSWTQKKIKDEAKQRGNKAAHAHLDRFNRALNKIKSE